MKMDTCQLRTGMLKAKNMSKRQKDRKDKQTKRQKGGETKRQKDKRL
jgi:hypothetical protein